MLPLVLNVFNVFTKHVHKLKQVTNLIIHDKNYTSFVVSLLIHKMGEREGGTYLKGGDYFKFWPIGGRHSLEGGAYLKAGAYFKFWPIGMALIGRGRLFEGGANLKIYGISKLKTARLVNHYTVGQKNGLVRNPCIHVPCSRLFQTGHLCPGLNASIV